MRDTVQNFTSVNQGAEKTVIRFLIMKYIWACNAFRVMMFHNGRCSEDSNVIYLPTNKTSSNRKKEEKKDSMRDLINNYCYKYSPHL